MVEWKCLSRLLLECSCIRHCAVVQVPLDYLQQTRWAVNLSSLCISCPDLNKICLCWLKLQVHKGDLLAQPSLCPSAPLGPCRWHLCRSAELLPMLCLWNGVVTFILTCLNKRETNTCIFCLLVWTCKLHGELKYSMLKGLYLRVSYVIAFCPEK